MLLGKSCGNGMFSMQINKLSLMELNCCGILTLHTLHKKSGIGIIELALPFVKISPKYFSVTSEDL